MSNVKLARWRTQGSFETNASRAAAARTLALAPTFFWNSWADGRIGVLDVG
jgi:hypothetical protein